MRKLASIQVIEDIFPIEGKDKIVSARVLGWNVIVTKEFQKGDKVIYCEIDSVLPEKPEFEFLRSKNFRIKTMKMAGTISQGICFPMSILGDKADKYDVGDDVTDVIGVKKYEPQEDESVEVHNTKKNPLMRFKWYRKLFAKSKTSHSSFPSLISKTDEIRIQTVPWILSDKSRYIATEKVDGSSGSFLLVKRNTLFGPKYDFTVCSRNLALDALDDSIYWKVAIRYGIKDVLKNIMNSPDYNGTWIAIQGECIGPKVQKNKYNVTVPDLYVFNMITPSGRIGSLEAKAIVEKYGMKFVPIVNDNFILPDTVDEMIDIAHGKSMLGNTIREGLVVRSVDGKKSFKAVDPKFLLKYSE